jgi:hypothetical protein
MPPANEAEGWGWLVPLPPNTIVPYFFAVTIR